MQTIKRLTAAGLGVVIVALLTGASVPPTAGQRVTLSGPSPLHCPGLPGTITNFAAEPHLAVNPRDRGNIVAAWQQDRSFGARGTVASYSRDSGRTWHTVTVPGADSCTPGQVAVADPWLTFDGAGTAYLASLAGRPGPAGQILAGLFVNRSDDGGATWSARSMVTNFETFDDKPSITADPNRSGVVYATWDRPAPCDTAPCGTAVHVAVSTDGARTWSTPLRVAPSPRRQHNARIVVLPDGALRLVYDEKDVTAGAGPAGIPWDLQMIGSADGGAHWSAPQTVTRLREYLPTDASGRQFKANFTENVTVDARGHLYVVSTDNTSTASDNPSAVRVRVSTDGGATWQRPTTIALPEGHASTPSISVNAQGRVAMTWYDFADDRSGDGSWTMAYRAASGQLAAPNWHIRTLSRFDATTCGNFSVPGFPGQKIPWIGEYIGLDALDGARFGSAYVVCAPEASVGIEDIVFATF